MSSTTRVVRSHRDLSQVVADYLEFDEFAFDTETKGDRKVRMTPGERRIAEAERNSRLRDYRDIHPDSDRPFTICPCDGKEFISTHGRQFCSEACQKAAAKDRPALDPRWNTVWSVSLAGPGRSDVIPCGHPTGPRQLWRSDVFEILQPLLFSKRRKIGHNVSFDLLSVAKYYGNQIPPPPYGDTWVLYFLLNENLITYNLEALAKRYLGYEYTEKLGEKAYQATFQEAMRYSVIDSKISWLLWWRVRRQNLGQSYWDRFERDMDVLGVLMDMRAVGAYIDSSGMVQLKDQLIKQQSSTLRSLRAMAGRDLNINSTRELGQFIYDDLDLPCESYTAKGGRSTDAQTLKDLARSTRQTRPKEAIETILRYKDLTKMLGTYVAGYFPHIDRDGRIRASFNLAVAKTGRLSCSQPNLQNIPARYKQTFESTMVRRLFKAPPGRMLIVADYSQIELRILAHYTARYTTNSLLLVAYQKEIDLHALSASRIYRVPIDKVTKDQRFLGKTANFALAFEGGAGRLMDIADISEFEARRVYKAWHETYPEVRRWGDRIKEQCRDKEYVRTLFGRKRRLPEINYRDDKLRSYAERQAVNHPIQGTAAEVAKIALIQVSQAISGYDAKLVLQIHDEFIIECAEDQAERVVPLVRKAMEDIRLNGEPVLRVPLVVDIAIGENWADAKL